MLRKGLFGNHLRSWDSLAAVDQDGYTGPCSLRSKIVGGPCHNYIPVAIVRSMLGDWMINESPDDDRLIGQGEVMRREGGLYLFYSREQAPMRLALQKSGKVYTGMEAHMLLKSTLDANSWNDLQDLFEFYPSSVIEFSTYSYCLGVYPNRNTIIWEVRDY